MKALIKILKDVSTGIDGESYDVIRLLSILVVLVALGLTIYTVVYKQTNFDIQSYGIGIGSIFAAIGAALKLKESTEPSATETTPSQQ